MFIENHFPWNLKLNSQYHQEQDPIEEIFVVSMTPPQTIARNCADLNFLTPCERDHYEQPGRIGNLIDSLAVQMSVSRSDCTKIKSVSGVTPTITYSNPAEKSSRMLTTEIPDQRSGLPGRF